MDSMSLLHLCIAPTNTLDRLVESNTLTESVKVNGNVNSKRNKGASPAAQWPKVMNWEAISGNHQVDYNTQFLRAMNFLGFSFDRCRRLP
jgi:hypothetical protein